MDKCEQKEQVSMIEKEDSTGSARSGRRDVARDNGFVDLEAILECFEFFIKADLQRGHRLLRSLQ